MSNVVDKVWATLEPLTDPEIPVVTLRAPQGFGMAGFVSRIENLAVMFEHELGSGEGEDVGTLDLQRCFERGLVAVFAVAVELVAREGREFAGFEMRGTVEENRILHWNASSILCFMASKAFSSYGTDWPKPQIGPGQFGSFSLRATTCT